jgi:tryptophanase
MSSKKDGLVNIGGLLCFRHRDLFEKCSVYNILYEGFNTYGGLAGRDMAALATGLREVSSETYLESRIRQVERLGEKIREFGIEIQYPTGGHAVFVNATHFMEHLPEDEFRAQTLAVELYLESGVRSVEIGPLLADRHPVSRKNRFPETEFLRLAIPRRVYTDNHMDFVAVALQRVFERRKAIKRGLYIIREAPIMRHFTIQLGRH